MYRKNIIQRAYELADTGEFVTTTGIGRALAREGYLGVPSLVAGLGFRREIKERIRLARMAGGEKDHERPTRH